jgi:hypothetical protein
MLFVMFPMFGLAIVGIGVAWSETYAELRQGKLPRWRRNTALASILALIVQAALFIAFFFVFLLHAGSLAWVIRGEILFFLIALPCALTRTSPSRWWLLYLRLSWPRFLSSTMSSVKSPSESWPFPTVR